MSYQVLARKWRPRTFREMVGQQHVLQALINALDYNRLHHAYLFTGTRGVGKTTIARILAKCLNCEVGVSSEPCGQCSSCIEISEGRFVDLIEVDAASRTKVEDTRELLENVQYAPTRGRYKVYLIDEVHMLSAHSFNALLKTLEEPPPHVKFLLATTDPQKLPVTILSRCLQFHLKNMTPERIVGHLRFVLEQEMVPFEEAALWQLGRSADGSMRDAMSLTDQAIAYGSGKVTDSDVSTMLGTVDPNLVYDLLAGLASQQAVQVLAAVDRLSQHSPDYSAALAELLSVLHRVAIAQTLPEAVDNSRGDRERVLLLAQQLPSEDIQLFYQTALLGRRDLPLAPDVRGGFEMVLLRMLAFKPQGVRDVPTQALPVQSALVQPTSSAASSVAAPSVSVSPVSVSSSSLSIVNPLTTDAPVVDNALVSEPTIALVADPEITTTVATTTVATTSVPREHASVIPQQAAVYDDNSYDDNGAMADYEQYEPQPAYEDYPLANNYSASDVLAHEGQSLKKAEQPVPESPAAITSRAVVPSIAHTMAVSSHAVNAKPAAVNSVPTAKLTCVEKVSLPAATPDNWIQIYLGLGVGGVLQSTVSNCVLLNVEGSRLRFLLDANNSTLYDESHQQRFSQLLSQYFEQSVEAVIQVGNVDRETPAASATRLRTERKAQALVSINTDPLVLQLLSHFDAVLQLDTVVPID